MKNKFGFAHSLLLAIAAGCVAPVLLCSALCGLVLLLAHIPPLAAWGSLGNRAIAMVLQVLGDGSPLQGLLTISIACGAVSGLFDTYAFYSFSGHRN
jgi:hypothetical protein